MFAHLHGKHERHVELVLLASAAGVDEGNSEGKAHQEGKNYRDKQGNNNIRVANIGWFQTFL